MKLKLWMIYIFICIIAFLVAMIIILTDTREPEETSAVFITPVVGFGVPLVIGYYLGKYFQRREKIKN